MKDLPDICLEIENSLPLWVGGDLEADAQTAVEEHLVQCERCARNAARARAARGMLLRGLRLEGAALGSGPELWPALRDALRAEGLSGAAPVAEAARPSRRRWSPAWSVAAAVLFGLFLAGIWWPSRGGEVSPPPPSVPVAVHPADIVPGGPIVAQPAGLRLISPGEPRLRDSAEVYVPRSGIDPASDDRGLPKNPGSPASLERVRHPR